MHSTLRRAPALLAPVAVAICALAPARTAFDPAPFLADLQALEDSTAAGYANLEWQVKQGVVDPVALHRRTDSLIRRARSEGDARDALIEFGEAFRDGHYRIRKHSGDGNTRATSPATPPPVADGGSRICTRLGYRGGMSGSMLSGHGAYRSVANGSPHFPAGLIERGSHRIGVLRIHSFGIDRFAAVCAIAWHAASREDSSGFCAGRCQSRLRIATSDSLLAEVRRSIGALVAAGATALVVDLTGNGGGTNWVTPAARQFTKTRLNGHIAGEIRHPHYHRRLIDGIAELDRAIAATADAEWLATLETAKKRGEAQLAAVRAPCDRRAIWREGPKAVTCSQLATETFTTGFLEYLPPSARGRPGAGTAFGPARYAYEEGTWSGPLFIVADKRTASASEDFVVALKDNGAAYVVGERTYGAGCGYTNGGIGFVLPNTNLEVAMPDCARIRRSGQNEVSGVEPDERVSINANSVVSAILKKLTP